MKSTINTLTVVTILLIFSQNSYAVLDDNLGLTDRAQKAKTFSKVKAKSVRSPKSTNSKKMIAQNLKVSPKAFLNANASKKALGAVPRHIQENWNKLSNDQKEIIYSYHNENPYAEINKEHFKNISRPDYEYRHDNAKFGFDANQQGNLDHLRADINENTKEGLSDEDQKIVDTLAALEE